MVTSSSVIMSPFFNPVLLSPRFAARCSHTRQQPTSPSKSCRSHGLAMVQSIITLPMKRFDLIFCLGFSTPGGSLSLPECEYT